MAKTSRTKLILVGALIATVVIVTPLAVLTLLNIQPPPQPTLNIRFTLLENAGVMIEHEGVRIYIDPYELPQSYDQLPADAVLITHAHFDHYQPESLNLVQQTGTVNVFPENMSAEIIAHGGVGVNPGDEVTIEHITVRAFYQYGTEAPLDTGHPRESNLTSYIVDIGGFTIFHAGDSNDIEEYAQLTGTINVALLPTLIFNSQDVLDSLDTIQPDYFIPIHTTGSYAETFVTTYESQITCECLALDNFEMHIF